MQVQAAAVLLAEWARRDFRIRYTQTLLGSLWALVQPIALTAAFVFLFRRVAKIDVGIPYASFVFPGMLMWALFSTGVSTGSNAMLTSMNIAAKANYPRVVAPLSAVLLPLVDLFAGLLMLPILLVIQRPGGHIAPLTFLGALIGCLALSAGIGIFLSAVTVFIRDIRNVVPLVLQLGLLITPVGYPGTRLPEWLSYSPLATFVEGFRSSVVSAPSPSATRWVVAYVATGLVLVSAFTYFHRVERRFPDVA
jgi:ABC-type polysaccharide/polyol phosphate export permease